MNVPERRRTPVRPLTWLSLAVPLLFACGQNANVPANPDPYAGGVSYPWTYTAPEGQLSAQQLNADNNTLSYETVLSAKNAWGPIEKDRSNNEKASGDGNTLTLNGKAYNWGFGVHAGSEIRFGLKGVDGATCKFFTTNIGVDDEVGNKGSVIFQVYLDGVKAYDSGKMTGASVTKKINLNIVGKQELRLVVTDAGDGISYDHADWANPRVDCRTVAGPQPGRLDESYGTKGLLKTGGVDVVQEPSGALLIMKQFVDGNFVLERMLADPETRVTKVSTDLGGEDMAQFLLRQPDGKIILVGSSFSGSVFSESRDYSLALVRYNTDLSLDTSFGVGGKILTLIQANITPYVDEPSLSQVALAPDGRIIVGILVNPLDSSGKSDPESDDLLLRYNADGKIDKSFGNDGKIVFNLKKFDNGTTFYRGDYIYSIAAQQNGKIVLAVFNSLIRIVRLNVDGSFDTGFGEAGNGIITLASGYPTKIVVLPNNEILFGGAIYTDEASRTPVLIRLSSNGRAVKTMLLPFEYVNGAGDYGNLVDFKMQSNGSILVSVSFYYDTGFDEFDEPTGKSAYFTTRLKPDLSIDAAFGNNGKGENFFGGKFIQYSENEILVNDYYGTVARLFP